MAKVTSVSGAGQSQFRRGLLVSEHTAPSTAQQAPAVRSGVRPEIQALRAIAVLAVVFYHLWPVRLPGGFVGVDIFFVISGFLITGLLFRDHERTGKISLTGFYGRRVRRIVPAAVTVLIVTSVVGYFLFNTPRAMSTIWDSVQSFFFIANWHFAAIGTDYFHATDPASPVQHYWSLSVEEQFYLVWPWLMVLLFAIAGKSVSRTQRGRVVVGVVMAVIVAASFAYAMWETATDPTVAYFSTFSRVWELGIGALLAAAAPLFLKVPTAVRAIVGWIGLAGIIASFFVITDALPFPGPWAALPVGATILVLAAGIGGHQKYLFPIANPVGVFFGNISYSLYLWHFPVITFAAILIPKNTPYDTAIVLAAILIISLVSYFLIEQPFHRSPWLKSFGKDRELKQKAWQDWRDRFGTQFILSTIGVIAIASVVIVATGIATKGGIPQQAAGPAASTSQEANPLDQVQADLANAVGAQQWPSNLSPSLDSAISNNSRDNPANACFAVGNTPDFGSCTWGNSNAANHMYVVGDSEALSYAPAFKAIAENTGGSWKITTIGLYGCRFTDALIQNDGAGVMDACAQRKQDIAARIAGDHPQLVVIANAFALGQTQDGTGLSAGQMVQSTFAEAAKYDSAGKIVYLTPPPLGAELGSCYSAVSSPQNCNVGIDPVWNQFEKASEASEANGDHVISSLPFSCYNGICPAFAGTIPTKYDTVHMTPEYSTQIARALWTTFVNAGLM